MTTPIDLEQYEKMSTLEKAELLHKVWTEKGFKAPGNVLNYSPIFPEQALGYLEVILENPEEEVKNASRYVMAKNLIMLWCLVQVPTATEEATIKSE